MMILVMNVSDDDNSDDGDTGDDRDQDDIGDDSDKDYRDDGSVNKK